MFGQFPFGQPQFGQGGNAPSGVSGSGVLTQHPQSMSGSGQIAERAVLIGGGGSGWSGLSVKFWNALQRKKAKETLIAISGRGDLRQQAQTCHGTGHVEELEAENEELVTLMMLMFEVCDQLDEEEAQAEAVDWGKGAAQAAAETQAAYHRRGLRVESIKLEKANGS